MFKLLIFLVLSGSALAQQAQVTFKFDYAHSRPNHYTINVRQDGTSDYESYDDDSMGEDEHYRRSFAISAELRERIFAHAKKADYFHGDFDYKKDIAFTGKKTLIYSAGGKAQSTSYNWSQNQAIQQLTEIMQGISITIEAELRLRHLRRFDKLGLNAELAQLEQRASNGWLRELHLIAKCLQDIANDRSVVSVARNRAERLLKLAVSGPQPEEKAAN